MTLDDDDVAAAWRARRGPGYFAIILISLLVSAAVVAGAQLALARWGSVQALLGGAAQAPAAERVAVPAITKLPLAAASELLASRGLKLLSMGSTFDPEVPPGHVAVQGPAPGTRIARDETVRVTLSSGPPLVAVPPLVGADLLAVQRQLEQAGLRLGSIQTNGVVLRVTSSQPAAGEQAAQGTPVVLTVELGTAQDAVAPSGASAPSAPGTPAAPGR